MIIDSKTSQFQRIFNLGGYATDNLQKQNTYTKDICRWCPLQEIQIILLVFENIRILNVLILLNVIWIIKTFYLPKIIYNIWW